MSFLISPKMQVHLKHLLENYEVLKSISNPAIPAAVVKDDAYGLGADIISAALYQNGCRAFFVAHGSEGAVVRTVAPDADIYVLQGMGEDSLPFFQSARLTPVVSSPTGFLFWKEHKISGVKPILNVETGLNRLGFRPADLAQLTDADKGEFSFIMSHLSCGDDAHHFMNEHQLTAFDQARKVVPELPASLSASDGVFLGDSFHFNMVRLGAAMYGLNTAPYRQNKMKPVLYVQAPVLQVVDIPVGAYVGYSAAFQAKKAMTIAIVSIGYGDGLFRSLEGRGRVWINGHEARLVGRLSMDNIMIDVTGLNVHIGDLVDVLNDTYTADDMGKDAGTIGYEVLSRIGKGKRFCKSVIK